MDRKIELDRKIGRHLDRRQFLARAGSTLGAVCSLPLPTAGAEQRRLKIGHTGITWNEPPQAIHDIAELGYNGYETFGDVLESWMQKGGLKAILDTNNLPLISAYCGVNLTDPA